MRATLRSYGTRRRGAVAVMVAISLVPILLVTAMTLDLGLVMSRRRHCQATADAAAHAATCMLARNYSTNGGLDPNSTARNAAVANALANGYANDGTTSSVAVHIPPVSGNFAGKSGNAEVVITYHHPRYFSAVLGSDKFQIKARAVGRTVVNVPTSILLTDTSSSGAFTLTGGARLTTNGGIQVNSSHAWAVNASNGAYATDNGGISVVGGYTIPNWATASTFFKVAPTTNQSSVADPFASLPAPSASGMTARSAPNPPYGSATIYPGVYSGGLTLGGGMTITMSPGTYYMQGGGFTVANGVRLTGSGVTIYIDSGGGALSFQGGTTVTLTAPTGGTYAGVVYYQNRSNGSSLNNIANGSTVNMSGTLYAPNAPFAIAGGASGASYGTQLIVKTLSLSNGVNVTINTPQSAIDVAAPFIAE